MYSIKALYRLILASDKLSVFCQVKMMRARYNGSNSLLMGRQQSILSYYPHILRHSQYPHSQHPQIYTTQHHLVKKSSKAFHWDKIHWILNFTYHFNHLTSPSKVSKISFSSVRLRRENFLHPSKMISKFWKSAHVIRYVFRIMNLWALSCIMYVECRKGKAYIRNS